MWLEPLEALRHDGDPAGEIAAYVERKLEMSRDNPKASRLFAMEIIQGAPVLGDRPPRAAERRWSTRRRPSSAAGSPRAASRRSIPITSSS